MESVEKAVAKSLMDIKAVMLRPENPFTWASGWKSPIYCDNRKILSYPEIRQNVCTWMADIIRKQYPDVEVIAGGGVTEEISMATGYLAYPYLKRLIGEIEKKYPGRNVHLYPIRNDFFGEMITVSGLLTGQDICKQLADKPLGQVLYLPENVLRSGEQVFLDDMTVTDVQNTLQVELDIVKSNGYDLVSCMLGPDRNALSPVNDEI